MSKTQQEKGPRIRRAKVDSLDLYEITEDELTTLEHGSPGSLFLLFSTFLLSVAISFLISILSTKIENNHTYIFFVVITVVGFVVGLVLLGLWIKENKSSTSVSMKIRERMKDDIVNQELIKTTTDENSTIGNSETGK